MKLSGKEIQEIRDAILDGYGSVDALRMMVKIELEESLEEIAGGENLRVLVFNLITWAERFDRVDELIKGAARHNSGNHALQKLVESWGARPPATVATDEAGAAARRDDRSAKGGVTTDARGSQGAIFNASGPIEQHYHGLSAEEVSALLKQVGQIKGAEQPRMWDGPASLDLFLSYSRKDLGAMHEVEDVLRAADLSVWTDEGLEPGTPVWQDAIEAAVHQAKAMIVLLSPHARNSRWVRNEISFAQAQNKTVFPILISGDTSNAVPIGLINVHWVDGREKLRAVVELELLPELRRHLGHVSLLLHPLRPQPSRLWTNQA